MEDSLPFILWSSAFTQVSPSCLTLHTTQIPVVLKCVTIWAKLPLRKTGTNLEDCLSLLISGFLSELFITIKWENEHHPKTGQVLIKEVIVSFTNICQWNQTYSNRAVNLSCYGAHLKYEVEMWGRYYVVGNELSF